MNRTTAIIAFLLLLTGCYEGPDTGVGDTESVSTDAVDTEPAQDESGGGDLPPSPPDSAEDDDVGDASTGNDTEDSGPSPVDPDAVLVEFRIQPGTQHEAWNTKDDTLVVNVGQTLLLINEDSIQHTLHTFGVPMAHGDPIEPGESARYVVAEPYDRGDETPELWDHETGEPAYFWLQVLPRDAE